MNLGDTSYQSGDKCVLIALEEGGTSAMTPWVGTRVWATQAARSACPCRYQVLSQVLVNQSLAVTYLRALVVCNRLCCTRIPLCHAIVFSLRSSTNVYGKDKECLCGALIREDVDGSGASPLTMSPWASQRGPWGVPKAGWRVIQFHL